MAETDRVTDEDLEEVARLMLEVSEIDALPAGSDARYVRGAWWVVHARRMLPKLAREVKALRSAHLTPSDAARLLRFLRKLPGLDGLGEREEPILDALRAMAEEVSSG